MSEPILREYEPGADRAAVVALWEAAIAPVWPVLPRAVDGLTRGVVAERDGVPVGFAAVEGDAVALLAVRPGHRRRGVGTALLAAAARLGAVRAGGGAVWPGAPLDLPDGIAVLTARGWTARPDVADLTQDLRSFAPPRDTSGIAPVHCELVDPRSVRWFAEAEFPAWTDRYLAPGAEVAAARADDRRVIGALVLAGPAGADGRPALAEPGAVAPPGAVCAPLLGDHHGTIACVGVERARHGQGVGSALVAFAATVLRDRGVRTCLVDWVERESFYGRLGFTPWRRYRPFTAPPA